MSKTFVLDDSKINTNILIGGLIGDSYIPRLYGRRLEYKLGWTHKKDHAEYAIWKAEKLGINYYTYYRDRYDKRTNKTYSSIEIATTTDSLFRYYRYLFYKTNEKGTKKINSGIIDLLTPEAIAVWYCDDGSLYINKRTGYHLYLAVDAFSEECKEYIKLYFKRKYNINFKNSRSSLRITSKEQVLKFMDIVKPYITCECMRYKIYES